MSLDQVILGFSTKRKRRMGNSLLEGVSIIPSQGNLPYNTGSFTHQYLHLLRLNLMGSV